MVSETGDAMKIQIGMKLVAVVCGLLMSVTASGQYLTEAAVRERQLYRLTGTISSCHWVESRSPEVVRLTIDHELTNTSAGNLILWKRNMDDSYGEKPVFLGKTIARTSDFDGTGIILDEFGGPSNDYSDRWTILRKKLDKPSPPEDVTTILRPGDVWKFTSEVAILIGREEKVGSKPTLEYYKSVSPVWLKTKYELWSFNIDPRGNNRGTRTASKLKKRWASYGTLLMEYAISEPIELDFRKLNCDGK